MTQRAGLELPKLSPKAIAVAPEIAEWLHAVARTARTKTAQTHWAAVALVFEKEAGITDEI